MTTALQIVTEALGLVGVYSPGQRIEADDSAFALDRLNELIDGWGLSRLYAASASHATFTVAGTVSTVTVGPGLNVDTPRPVRIADGFVRRGGYDYPFQMVDRATYDLTAYKGGGGNAPDVAWYDGDRTIHFAPPFTGGELHIPVESAVASFATLATDRTLPQGYRRALALTLAEELATHYSRELPRSVVQRAINARRAIKRANHLPPILQGMADRPSAIFAGTQGSFDGIENGAFPRAGVGAANAWQTANVKALFDSMAFIPGSASGGKTGGPFTVKPGPTQYGWVAVLQPQAAAGVIFTGALGPGGWSGAGLAGNNTGPSPSLSTLAVPYVASTGTYLLFRQDYAGAEFTGYIS